MSDELSELELAVYQFTAAIEHLGAADLTARDRELVLSLLWELSTLAWPHDPNQAV
jgi:hypothetical protein